MKKLLILFLGVLCGCASLPKEPSRPHYKMQTQREEPFYLSIDAEKVEDTCPGNDILKTYSCTKEQPDGFACFDVYMVQGRPAGEQEYSLLQETVQEQPVSAEPQCPSGMQADCASFLKSLHNNLEFSWYLVDFPSSSFPQCKETYDCKRVDCYLPVEGDNKSVLVSCVYKRNQFFFVGADVSCRREPR